MHTTHRVLAYLKGTTGQRLLFKRGGGTSIELNTNDDYGASITSQGLYTIELYIGLMYILIVVHSLVEILSLGEAIRKMLLLDLVPKQNIKPSSVIYKR